MKIALTGLPKSGKTTVFNALTGLDIATDKYSPPADEANMGIVTVKDERITRLSEMYKPKKTIYPTIEFHDFPGMFAKSGENPENSMYAELKTCDAFAIVMRAFLDNELDELYGAPDVLRQMAHINDEMILADLIVAEKRLEKIELGYKRGVKTPAIQIEEKALRSIVEALQNNTSIRQMEISKDEEKAIKGFQFFSAKPLLVLLNTTETDYLHQQEVLSSIRQEGFMTEVIAGKFEQELSTLSEEEAAMFMDDAGIGESIRDRLTRLCYELLGYISFFTVGEDEVRAWTIEKGTNAVNAAGKIHSDLARGFIRAECFSYADLMAQGNEKHLREKGLFRLEGKEYPVKDGDILNIRFNV